MTPVAGLRFGVDEMFLDSVVGPHHEGASRAPSETDYTPSRPECREDENSNDKRHTRTPGVLTTCIVEHYSIVLSFCKS
jgi:hypothetical protein